MCRHFERKTSRKSAFRSRSIKRLSLFLCTYFLHVDWLLLWFLFVIGGHFRINYGSTFTFFVCVYNVDSIYIVKQTSRVHLIKKNITSRKAHFSCLRSCFFETFFSRLSLPSIFYKRLKRLIHTHTQMMKLIGEQNAKNETNKIMCGICPTLISFFINKLTVRVRLLLIHSLTHHLHQSSFFFNFYCFFFSCRVRLSRHSVSITRSYFFLSVSLPFYFNFFFQPEVHGLRFRYCWFFLVPPFEYFDSNIYNLMSRTYKRLLFVCPLSMIRPYLSFCWCLVSLRHFFLSISFLVFSFFQSFWFHICCWIYVGAIDRVSSKLTFDFHILIRNKP